MKKLSILVLALLVIMTLFIGCTARDESPGDTQENDQEEEQTDTEEPNDAETTASIVDDESAFLNAIGENGTWIICTLNDLTIDEELIVEGEFRDKDDENNDLYRKIALYAQDADRNVTERYTLTAPKMTVRSPNTNIVNGTFVGDIYVEAEGFVVNGATIDGNVYFANEEYESSFELTNDGEVTGDTKVQSEDDDTTNDEDTQGSE